MLCNLCQSLLPPWTWVTHGKFPSTSCFCPSSETPHSTGHEYMQIYGLIMRLTCSRFKLSVLMVHLPLNYTLADVWLAVLIFTLRQLRRWRASQASVCLSCPVACFILLISNCWQNPGDIMVLIVTPNWFLHEHILGALWDVLLSIRSMSWPVDRTEMASVFLTTDCAQAMEGNRVRHKECPNIYVFNFTGIYWGLYRFMSQNWVWLCW